MVHSAPFAPAAARIGGVHSPPQTWTGNFSAIFWMVAMTKFEITHAYPFMSLAPALVFLLGVFVLNDEILFGVDASDLLKLLLNAFEFNACEHISGNEIEVLFFK